MESFPEDIKVLFKDIFSPSNKTNNQIRTTPPTPHPTPVPPNDLTHFFQSSSSNLSSPTHQMVTSFLTNAMPDSEIPMKVLQIALSLCFLFFLYFFPKFRFWDTEAWESEHKVTVMNMW